MLMHKAKDMKNLMNGNDEPVAEAASVQVNNLLSTLHPQLAGALRTGNKHHIVGARAVCREKGDARGPIRDVLHRIFHNCPVGPERVKKINRHISTCWYKAPWERSIELILNDPAWPQFVGVGEVGVGIRVTGKLTWAQQDVTWDLTF